MPKAMKLATSSASLEDWLEALFEAELGSDLFTTVIDFRFPTDAALEEFLMKAQSYSEAQVRRVLRHLLLPSCSLGVDELRERNLITASEQDPERFRQLMASELNRRLFVYAKAANQPPPWEGLTWVLDLLPNFPKEAIQALEAYLLAHLAALPDGRINGLSDAVAVIRAKYIGLPGSEPEKLEHLLSFEPRDFEHIVERLYSSLGYETKLTQGSYDGGRDIRASRSEAGKSETIEVECKRYAGTVGVAIVRAVLGVVSSGKVNKGAIVTTGRFSRPAQDLASANPRLELIDGPTLVVLLNENFGPRWPSNLDNQILESKRYHATLAT